MKSHFINPYGFDDRERKTTYGFDRCGIRLWPSTLYHVKARATKPVTWVDADGFGWTFNKSFWSDRGSVPNWVHWLCEPDTFLIPFYFHDSSVRFKGLHRTTGPIRIDDGKMIQTVPCETTRFVHLSRLDCDQMLRRWVLADGASEFQASGIYRGVRIGASLGIGGSWGEGDLKKKAG
jgi:hypothetical protein